MGLGCRALQAEGLGKDWRSCAFFVLLHNCLIKDIPGMTYLSKRDQLSSELRVPHPSGRPCVVMPTWGPRIQHARLMLPVHPPHTQTAPSAQVQVCLASTLGSASSQHWPYEACIALPPSTEARSSSLDQLALTVSWDVVARALGHCREDTQSYSSACVPALGVLGSHCWHFVDPSSPDPL